MLNIKIRPGVCFHSFIKVGEINTRSNQPGACGAENTSFESSDPISF